MFLPKILVLLRGEARTGQHWLRVHKISGVRVLSIRPPDLNRLPVVIVAFFIVVFLVAFQC